MRFDLTVFSLASLGFVAAPLAGALLGLHLKNRVPGLGLRDSIRAVIYVTQYDAALEYQGLRRRELRNRVDELRVNLAESARDGGVQAAIQRLGAPRVLAAEVAGARMVPSWSRGILWVAVAAVVGLFGLAMSTSAFLAAVESAVAPGATATWSPYFLTMTATSVPSGSPTFALDVPFTSFVLLVVPFLAGARIWRLWTGRRAHEPSPVGR